MRKVENALSKQGHDCKKPETVGQWILCHFLLLVGLGLALLFYVLNPNVFSSFGITSILSTASIQGIIALGLMMELTTGNFDLSIGATAGFSAAVLGAIMANASPNWYIPAVFIALAAAVLVGLLNAFITVRIGVPAFVGTMAIRSLLSGAISFLTNNTIFYSNNWGETYKLLGQGKIRNVIPYCCLIFLVICVACYIFLEHTKTGRYIYATGANRSAAKNVGIPVVRMQVLSFAIGALLAGIGGILHSSRNFQTSVQMGIDLHLPAQICCLLGATYKTPGKYNVPGCVVGILLTTIITNGVYGTIGSSIYIKSLVEGLVFMTAIGIIATIRQEGLPKVKFDI